MLEIRENCEHCNKHLPNHCDDAMICSYECTFCENCVTHILFNVCPNCGGGFEKRPTRPKLDLEKFPTRKDPVYNKVNHNKYLDRYKSIPPRER